MAKTLEDRISQVEEKLVALSKLVEGASLKKMKRQIRGLKAKSKKLTKDVGRTRKGRTK